MNGKMAKMLKRMKCSDHTSKRLLKSLDHVTRGKLRTAYKENPHLTIFEFLKQS